jgi:hypothetical protein
LSYIILGTLAIIISLNIYFYSRHLLKLLRAKTKSGQPTRELTIKKLRFNDVEAIEGWVSTGQVVEVRMTPFGVNVSHRPEEKSTMALPSPMLINESEHTNITITASNEHTEFPVVIETFIVPPGFYFSGITGYQEKKD